MLLSISFLMLVELFLTETFTDCSLNLSISFSILLLLFQSKSGSALPQPTSITCHVVIGFHVSVVRWKRKVVMRVVLCADGWWCWWVVVLVGGGAGAGGCWVGDAGLVVLGG